MSESIWDKVAKASAIPRRGERSMSLEQLADSFQAHADNNAPELQAEFCEEYNLRALSAAEYAAVLAVYMQSGGTVARYDERPLAQVVVTDPEAASDMPVQWLVRKKFEVSRFSFRTSPDYPMNLVVAEGNGEGLDDYQQVVPGTDFDEGYFGSVLWFDPGIALVGAVSVRTRLPQVVISYPNVNEILAQRKGQSLEWAMRSIRRFSSEVQRYSLL